MNRRQLLTSLPAFGAGLTLPGRPALASDKTARLRELYNRDMSFSDFALEQEGKRTEIWGFMAPPLKADSVFFVLTNRPMAVCPFCEPGMPWPNDILAVYAKRVVNVIAFNVPITVNGVLELGDHVDPELGFYSKVRLSDATYARV
ncbi:MAG: hypothetical protein Q4G14_05670 [Paracoccus sp. (in: a-proteobacteria)]|uniref:hypothetical protein n=1 Tax=Paracoccus sp. TaxID=267 RepID=UPI0026DF79F7|nr:hypothetical protein [Paracoccus sp. (in: a-proteobacteria)]MDO5612717.1 hypothetical protein [Paracoccus sp. (in: a-proteobacteria)]